ncbi:MAG: sodium-dependent transporter, partial [Clostridia bacterium]|nr:sodium-dependent transporter [Clostridia bacterium]
MDKKKNGFASGLGFVLASAGSAVGLGNLWGFPYKTQTYGGAAFVLVYIACVLLIGAVTMVCEIFIGRRAQANPVTAFKKVGKNVGWFGVLAILIPGFIACYYSVLGGYTVRFTVNSFKGNAGTMDAFAANGWLVTLFTAIFIAIAIFVVMAGVKGGIEKASKVLMPALFVLLLGTAIFSLCLGEGVGEGLKFYLKPDFS